MGNIINEAVKATSFSFKGDAANDRQFIFATIQGIGFDKLSQAFINDQGMQQFLSEKNIAFPDDEADVNEWLAELDND